MKTKNWTSEEMEQAKKLAKTNSYSTVGKILHRSKNSVLGVLYRDKIKNVYTPSLDSPYARIRKYRKGY